jgi:plasmid maintenance system killer protein
MQVGTRDKGLMRALEDDREATKRYGAQMAKQIKKRIAALSAADSLADFWPPNSGPERCHELKGGMAGIYSLDLNQPFRLLFKPSEQVSENTLQGEYSDVDEKVKWQKIRAVEIIEIRDTHG